MHTEQYSRLRFFLSQNVINCCMIGVVEVSDTTLSLRVCDMPIGGHGYTIAFRNNKIMVGQISVATNQKP